MKAKFTKVHIEVSNICNLQCSFCPEVIRTKKFIELPLFESILRQVAPMTEQVALHLMGEPLTHSRFPDLVAACEKAGVLIHLVSNGVLLREKHVDLLLGPAFRQINFSLHSFGDNFPDQDPTTYLEKIFLFVERALVERPDLYLNFRLWNLQDVSDQVRINADMLARIEKRFLFQMERVKDVRSRKSFRIQGRLYLHFDTEFVWPDLALPELGERGTCYGLTSHFGILVDGTVVPCCLDKEGSIALGNAYETPITEILASPRAQAILGGFARGRLVESLCKRCNYIERFAGRVRTSKSGLGVTNSQELRNRST